MTGLIQPTGIGRNIQMQMQKDAQQQQNNLR
jgi:hypothetical protein